MKGIPGAKEPCKLPSPASFNPAGDTTPRRWSLAFLVLDLQEDQRSLRKIDPPLPSLLPNSLPPPPLPGICEPFPWQGANIYKSSEALLYSNNQAVSEERGCGFICIFLLSLAPSLSLFNVLF